MRGRELIPGKPVCPEFWVVRDLGISGAGDNQMSSIIGGYFRSALVQVLRTQVEGRHCRILSSKGAWQVKYGLAAFDRPKSRLCSGPSCCRAAQGINLTPRCRSEWTRADRIEFLAGAQLEDAGRV